MPTRAERDLSAAFQNVEEIGKLQRLQGLSRRHDAIDHISMEGSRHRIHARPTKPVIEHYRLQSRIQCAAGHAPVQPMAEGPVRAIAPNIEGGGEGRMRPCIPAIGQNVSGAHHTAAIDGRDRICGRIEVRIGRIEGGNHRVENAPLHEIVARPPREVGQRIL